MLTKVTSKNQITIPKKIIDQIPETQYFDVELKEGTILLKPLKIYGTDLEQIYPARLQRPMLFPTDGVLQGYAHIRSTELGQQGAVHELHQGVYDGSRVNHHLDPVVGQSEQVVGFDDLEALVHQGR